MSSRSPEYRRTSVVACAFNDVDFVKSIVSFNYLVTRTFVYALVKSSDPFGTSVLGHHQLYAQSGVLRSEYSIKQGWTKAPYTVQSAEKKQGKMQLNFSHKSPSHPEHESSVAQTLKKPTLVTTILSTPSLPSICDNLLRRRDGSKRVPHH